MLAHLATTAEDASDLRRELPHAGGLGGSSALRRPYQRARPISRPRPVAAALLRDVLCAEALRGQQVLEAPGCDAAAVAGSARHFLAGLRALLACSAEVDRLTEAVEELERLAGPGGDLDMFVKVLHIDTARGDEMEVDGDARDGTLSLVDADLSGVYRVVRVNPNANPKFWVREMSDSGLCQRISGSSFQNPKF